MVLEQIDFEFLGPALHRSHTRQLGINVFGLVLNTSQKSYQRWNCSLNILGLDNSHVIIKYLLRNVSLTHYHDDLEKDKS